MNIGLDLDNTITASSQSIEFFSTLTRLFDHDHKIFIITNREPGTEQSIAEELDFLRIEYSELIITADKARAVKDNSITVFADDTDENHLDMPEEVLVLKVREPGNFDFAEKKWIGSNKTTKMI